jgi:hypothetical protein
MDGILSAASVIAVIQLAGSLVRICGSYIQLTSVVSTVISTAGVPMQYN